MQVHSHSIYAVVAELADALGSGPSGALNPVEVQVLSCAPLILTVTIGWYARVKVPVV